MDPEGIMLNEISQTRKDKYSIMSLTCVESKKKKKEQTQAENQK